MCLSSTSCSICTQSIALHGYPVRKDHVMISVQQTQRGVSILISSYEHLEAHPAIHREYGLDPSCRDRQGRVSLLIGVAQLAGCLQEQVDSPLELDAGNQ